MVPENLRIPASCHNNFCIVIVSFKDPNVDIDVLEQRDLEVFSP
jgi:hypothetical protein